MAESPREKIVFNFDPPQGSTMPSVELMVNPSSLTLEWRKILNKVRTKTRIVTFFWGEQPVRFTYQGQTGYIFPDAKDERFAVINNINKEIAANNLSILNEIDKLKVELGRVNGPYKWVTAQGNKDKIIGLESLLHQMSNPMEVLDLVVKETGLTNTALINVSKKYQVLKALEKLYREFQDPNTLLKVSYRNYIFSGYFEMFSFTDDATTPWNWRYSLEFTILKWEEIPVDSKDEIIFNSTVQAVDENFELEVVGQLTASQNKLNESPSKK